MISRTCTQNAKASLYMIKFQRSTSIPYTVITPLTPLGELEVFLAHNLFAISTSPCFSTKKDSLKPVAAKVTDSERKFLLAVATSQDLEVEFLPRTVTPVCSPRPSIEFCEETWKVLTYQSLRPNFGHSLYLDIFTDLSVGACLALYFFCGRSDRG